MSEWEDLLWKTLDGLPLNQQYQLCGEWINDISRSILPQLGKRRRRVVLEILAQPGWDAARLAEEVGTRRGAINRLAEEGRSDLRAERTRETVS